MLGINLLVRKQWTIHEKLAYPLAQIPLDIISNGPRVFKTPLTWVGFSIAVGINVLNGINHFFPNVPGIFARLLDSPVPYDKALEHHGLA